jgi:hypothetical protein
MAMAQFNPSAGKPHPSKRTQETMRSEGPVAAQEKRATDKISIGRPMLRKPGTRKGIWIAADFDGPLDDFRDYL